MRRRRGGPLVPSDWAGRAGGRVLRLGFEDGRPGVLMIRAWRPAIARVSFGTAGDLRLRAVGTLDPVRAIRPGAVRSGGDPCRAAPRPAMFLASGQGLWSAAPSWSPVRSISRSQFANSSGGAGLFTGMHGTSLSAHWACRSRGGARPDQGGAGS
jgi:hypothetical protein